MEQIYQASDFKIEIVPTIDNKALSSVEYATYVLYNKTGVVVTKTLGDGIVFTANKRLLVSLTDIDTAALLGTYSQECVVRDSEGKDIFVLKDSQVTFKKTIARINV